MSLYTASDHAAGIFANPKFGWKNGDLFTFFRGAPIKISGDEPVEPSDEYRAPGVHIRNFPADHGGKYHLLGPVKSDYGGVYYQYEDVEDADGTPDDFISASEAKERAQRYFDLIASR